MASKIIHTDNFGGDYPNEKFVEGLPRMTEEHAKSITEAINKGLPPNYPRWYKVVPEDYVLQPDFEP